MDHVFGPISKNLLANLTAPKSFPSAAPHLPQQMGLKRWENQEHGRSMEFSSKGFQSLLPHMLYSL